MLGGGAGCRMLVLGWCPDSVSGEMLLCITDGAAECWHCSGHQLLERPAQGQGKGWGHWGGSVPGCSPCTMWSPGSFPECWEGLSLQGDV